MQVSEYTEEIVSCLIAAMKRALIFVSVLGVGCGGNELARSESESVLTAEFPHDGTWEVVGRKPIVLREGYENEEVALEELNLDPNGGPEQAIQRAPDEG